MENLQLVPIRCHLGMLIQKCTEKLEVGDAAIGTDTKEFLVEKGK